MTSLHEVRRFLLVLTWRKCVNYIAAILSFYLSQFTKRPLLFHLPITMSFEPTTQCNLGCPECPSGLKSFSRETGNAHLDEYRQIVDKVKQHLIFIYLYFQGEPLIHKSFSDMVRIAKENRLYTVTSTNAHYLTVSKSEEIVLAGLDRILISIDGSTQEVYEQYRRQGNLNKVIEGTKNLIAAKKRLKKNNPEIIFQMLVVRPNEHQIQDVYELGRQLGVNQVVLKTAQVYDYANGHPLIPENTQYARYYHTSDGKWKLKNKLENQCWKLWHSMVCTWDGYVVPCCFDKDAQYKMGNLANQDLSEIWHGEAYKQFRKKLVSSRKEIDICQNCSEGTKVWESI